MMKMTKEEETEFFKDFTALMTKHDKALTIMGRISMMKMTKEEETEFFKDFTALMTKHDKVGYSIYINKYGRGNVDINLHYQRDFVDGNEEDW